jgi:hypothetical protein
VSQRPHRCRTWAPRGQTPILEHNFNWKNLSAVAGLTFLNFYFRLYAGAVKSPEVVDFLQLLVRHIRTPVLLVWIVCRPTAAGSCATISSNSRVSSTSNIYPPTLQNSTRWNISGPTGSSTNFPISAPRTIGN